VRDALHESCALETDIKWPNDIMVGERKLCGILAETIETETGRAVVVGIGINLDDRAFPPELKGIATSVSSLAGSAPDTEQLLQSLIRAIERNYEILQAANGEAETIRAWTYSSSYAQGRRVRVALMEETFEGWTRGLEPDGALRVETDQCEIRIIHAGDITNLRAGAKAVAEEPE
jgi:BirA family biotin operon repressor/biotin-[acetyl-CoA-carboxylase] ligase